MSRRFDRRIPAFAALLPLPPCLLLHPSREQERGRGLGDLLPAVAALLGTTFGQVLVYVQDVGVRARAVGYQAVSLLRVLP